MAEKIHMHVPWALAFTDRMTSACSYSTTLSCRRPCISQIKDGLWSYMRYFLTGSGVENACDRLGCSYLRNHHDVHTMDLSIMPLSTCIALGVATLLALSGSAFGADEFDPAYYANSWGGVCTMGKMQTPIDLPARYEDLPSVPMDLVTAIHMPVVKNPMLVNKGSAIQVRCRPTNVHLLRAAARSCS